MPRCLPVNVFRLILFCCSLSWLAACAPITPPRASAAPALPPSWQAPLPHGGSLADMALWWQGLDDPVLVGLVQAAQNLSPSAASALARVAQARARANVLPLGAGALAGVTYPIDRESVARELGFDSVAHNSMDAVADRDFVIDLHAAAALTMLHLSRLAEEIVLWSTAEFALIRLPDAFATGSSIMPQKKNPDVALAARRIGRAGARRGRPRRGTR